MAWTESKDWDEGAHPRDDSGRFASGAGGGGGGEDRGAHPSTTAVVPTVRMADLPKEDQDQIHSAVQQVPRTMGKPNATGTMADPIYVDGDLDHAVKEIYAGNHVRLDQPVQVATLVDKLGEVGKDAEAKGEQAPVYDLGLVTVPGTNLFTQESLGIPRIQMPQLSGEPTPGSPADKLPKDAKGRVNVGDLLQDELGRQGYKVTHEEVPPENLRATQMDLVGPQVAGMSKALDEGRLHQRELYVSRDNYVVDGHHQWAATVLSNLREGNVDKNIKVARVDADIGSLLDIVNEFTTSMGIPAQPGVAKTIAAVKRLLQRLRDMGESEWIAPDGRRYSTAAAREEKLQPHLPTEQEREAATMRRITAESPHVKVLEQPKRLPGGHLLIPDSHFGQREIDRHDPEYYTWLAEVPEIKRYRLMVGGEDLLRNDDQ